jgi:hypothetical protein
MGLLNLLNEFPSLDGILLRYTNKIQYGTVYQWYATPMTGAIGQVFATPPLQRSCSVRCERDGGKLLQMHKEKRPEFFTRERW